LRSISINKFKTTKTFRLISIKKITNLQAIFLAQKIHKSESRNRKRKDKKHNIKTVHWYTVQRLKITLRKVKLIMVVIKEHIKR
jgi:hypothetical protein